MTPDQILFAAQGLAMRGLIIAARVLALVGGALGWVPILGVAFGPLMVLILVVGIIMAVVAWVSGVRRTPDPATQAAVKRISGINITFYVIGIVIAISGVVMNILFALIVSGGADSSAGQSGF